MTPEPVPGPDPIETARAESPPVPGRVPSPRVRPFAATIVPAYPGGELAAAVASATTPISGGALPVLAIVVVGPDPDARAEVLLGARLEDFQDLLISLVVNPKSLVDELDRARKAPRRPRRAGRLRGADHLRRPRRNPGFRRP